MNEELRVYVGEEKPMTAIEVRGQVNLIQEVMKSVMQEGQHYGKIPGAGDKPTLLKPGAEKIMATFRLSVDPEIEDLSVDDRIRYRVKCRLLWPSGRFAGAGVGEASTDEEKYKWRGIVSEDEWNATLETGKRIKFRRDGQVKQIRTNPADLANTVLKMAKKRSLVDAVLTVTAASDIFTQDIEDMPSELLQGQQKSSLKEPQKKANGEAPGPDLSKKITEPQSKRFYAIAKGAGKTETSIKAYLYAKIGSEHSSDIPQNLYDEICLWAKEREPGAEG